MEIMQMRTMQTELKHFILERKDTGKDYIFLYYHTPVTIWIDNIPIRTRPGAWILYDQHSYQKFYCKGEVLHDWFHLRGNLNHIIQACHIQYNTIYYAPQTSSIAFLLQQIEIEWLRRDRYHNQITDLLIEALFFRLAQQQDTTQQTVEENMLSQLLNIRTNIHSHLDRNWNVKDMANQLSISEPHFYRLYRLVFGISPKADLINERIDRSKQILLYGSDPIPVVAEKVGFTNEYNFIRTFKSHTGMTPAKYRSSWLVHLDE